MQWRTGCFQQSSDLIMIFYNPFMVVKIYRAMLVFSSVLATQYYNAAAELPRWAAKESDRKQQDSRRRELLLLIHHHLQVHGVWM